MQEFALRRIGVIRSSLQTIEGAPCQGEEGAPDAWLEIDADYAPALSGIAAGDTLMLVTWLHLASRDVLEVHPRGDRRNPLAGVVATRSPHRPNPLGLHRVTGREVAATRLRVGPLEALDGTPLVDIKIALPLS